MLRCPVCKNSLSNGKLGYSCALDHVFDLSKEGYVNLLLAKKGVPGARGDNRKMLKSRRDFLSKGYFDFISTAIENTACKLLEEDLVSSGTCNILDIGCGEGYFLGRLARHLKDRYPSRYNSVNPYGMDVSKDALRMAARAHKDCSFFLANVHHEIPVQDRSITLITGICAPRNFEEFGRVLIEEGRLIIVIPTPRHLFELRSYFDLLQIDGEKERQIVELAENFSLLDSTEVESTVELGSTDVNNLLTMTPNYWHRAQTPLPVEKICTRFAFRVLTFKLS